MRLNSLIQIVQPKTKTSTVKPWWRLSPLSAIQLAESEAQDVRKREASKLKDGYTVLGVRKIRFYPKDESKFCQHLNKFRRAYNLMIAKYLDADKHFYETGESTTPDARKCRNEIKDTLDLEVAQDGYFYAKASIDEAVMLAEKSFKAVISKRKKGQKARLSFKSCKETVQSFIIPRLPANPKSFGGWHLTEDLPEEAIKGLTNITLDKGRWYVNAHKHITIKPLESQKLAKIVSCDPWGS